jgi:methyl-accepting chemotaxis protein
MAEIDRDSRMDVARATRKTAVINEIVFQTKLLSFNASVEAARAGEHGKGFAVVAEEVGNLAQMSGNASKDITDMLSDSIKKVNEIVESTRQRVEALMAAGLEKVNAGQMNAKKCNQALEKITDNARSVTAMIAKIASASKEQALGIQEINKAIGQLDSVTQQNTSVAQQSSNQADHLSTEAKALSQAINQLVSFVDGAKKASAAAPAHKTAAKKDEVKVVPFKQPVFYAQAKVPAPAPAAKPAPMQKAAGAEAPDANDPRFEDI